MHKIPSDSMKNFIYIALASSVAAFANAEIPAWHPPTKGEGRWLPNVFDPGH